MKTEAVQGVPNVSGESKEAQQAIHQGTGDAVAASLPAWTPDLPSASTGAQNQPADAAAPIGRGNSAMKELRPVGITTYTEVSRRVVECGVPRHHRMFACACLHLQPCVRCCLGEAATVALQFFTEAELQSLEAAADSTHGKAGTQLPPTAVHQTHALRGGLRRTKMFFGARCEPHALPGPQMAWTDYWLGRHALLPCQTECFDEECVLSKCRGLKRSDLLCMADLWTTEQKAGKDAGRACGVRVSTLR